MFMAVGLFLLGCPDIDTDPPPEVALCKPNSLSPCPCTDGKEGTQKCSVDGKRYGVCSCDAPKPPPVVNGCSAAQAEEHSEQVTTITRDEPEYVPSCIRIKAGNRVKFVDDFSSCPLVGGVVTPNGNDEDAKSPIKRTDGGTSVAFTFPSAGVFGFYCEGHTAHGNQGAVFVE
jgi:plastocyanin